MNARPASAFLKITSAFGRDAAAVATCVAMLYVKYENDKSDRVFRLVDDRLEKMAHIRFENPY